MTIFSFHSAGSWTGNKDAKDGNHWIQAMFDKGFKVTAIQTQGRSDSNQWVQTYKISYSSDGDNWIYASNDGQTLVRSL